MSNIDHAAGPYSGGSVALALAVDRGWLSFNVIRPAMLVALYGLVSSVLLPYGFNRSFVLILTVASCLVVAVAVLLSLVSVLSGRGAASARSIAGPERPARPVDAWLLLLPMAPVVQYLLVNREALTALGAAIGALVLAALASLFVLVLPFVLRRVMSRAVAMMAGLALSFVVYNMAAFARSNRWTGFEDAVLPLAVFAGVTVGGAMLYHFRREATYVVAGAYFVSMLLLIPFASDAISTAARDEVVPEALNGPRAEALAMIAERGSSELPDIVFLTYDSYVEDETMRGYGIDNSEQETYLESRGFQIERGTYTVAGDSIASMGRVLGGSSPGDAIAGGGALLDALGEAGYLTAGVFKSDYLFSRAEPAYDYSFPDVWPRYLTMLRGILEGRFRHDLAFSQIPHEDYVAEKRAMLATESDAPQLIYTHSGPGHSVNAAACRDDEIELFEQRLADANVEMREDIELVLERRPGAIVIVNGDHGPYLTKNCWGLHLGGYEMDEVTRLDIQDRFGSFLAIKWPNSVAPADAEITVLQDVLPAVLVEVFPDLDAEALRGTTRIVESEERVIAGVSVDDGVIVGGQLDGEPLFESAAR